MKTLMLFLIPGYLINPDRPDRDDILFLVDILTIIVGLFCITSIVIIGIQYLTAPTGRPKIRQSKRYLFEVIVGFIIYALFYALLHLLLRI